MAMLARTKMTFSNVFSSAIFGSVADPDPNADPPSPGLLDPDSSIIKQNIVRKTLISTVL